MIAPLTFFDMARASHVKRWHIINTVRTQTMAEHAFMVTLITMELMNRLGMKTDGPIELLRVIIGALVHDLSESRTGDLPTPGKRLINEAAGRDLTGEIEQALLPFVPYVGGLVPTYATHIMKMADLIADYHFLTDNAAGPYALAIREQLHERVLAYTAVCVGSMPEYNWSIAVDGIITDLVNYTYNASM